MPSMVLPSLTPPPTLLPHLPLAKQVIAVSEMEDSIDGWVLDGAGGSGLRTDGTAALAEDSGKPPCPSLLFSSPKATLFFPQTNKKTKKQIQTHTRTL